MNARHTVSALRLPRHRRRHRDAAAAPQSTTTAQPDSASAWTQATTPWGDPDLQGVWRYEAAIPLERPARFEGRESLTDEEVKESQRVEEEQAAQRLAGAEGAAVGRRSVGESPIRGNEYNSFWQDHGRPRQVSGRRRSSSIPRTAGSHTRPTPGKPRRAPAHATASGPTSRTSIPIPASAASPTASRH